MRSDAGKAYIAQLFPEMKAFVEMATSRAFSYLAINFDNTIDDVTSKSGVLSLTERPLNNEMWKRYAGDGTGFVIGLDAQHPFFIKERDGVPTNVLRKVIYTDEQTDNFWRNPYYLFLVKSRGWAYEQEWRMFKEFSKCDEKIGSDTAAIHLATLAPEIIKTVSFGYSYEAEEIEKDISSLTKYGCIPEFYRLQLNTQDGIIESRVF